MPTVKTSYVFEGQEQSLYITYLSCIDLKAQINNYKVRISQEQDFLNDEQRKSTDNQNQKAIRLSKRTIDEYTKIIEALDKEYASCIGVKTVDCNSNNVNASINLVGYKTAMESAIEKYVNDLDCEYLISVKNGGSGVLTSTTDHCENLSLEVEYLENELAQVSGLYNEVNNIKDRLAQINVTIDWKILGSGLQPQWEQACNSKNREQLRGPLNNIAKAVGAEIIKQQNKILKIFDTDGTDLSNLDQFIGVEDSRVAPLQNATKQGWLEQEKSLLSKTKYITFKKIPTIGIGKINYKEIVKDFSDFKRIFESGFTNSFTNIMRRDSNTSGLLIEEILDTNQQKDSNLCTKTLAEYLDTNYTTMVNGIPKALVSYSRQNPYFPHYILEIFLIRAKEYIKQKLTYLKGKMSEIEIKISEAKTALPYDVANEILPILKDKFNKAFDAFTSDPLRVKRDEVKTKVSAARHDFNNGTFFVNKSYNPLKFQESQNSIKIEIDQKKLKEFLSKQKLSLSDGGSAPYKVICPEENDSEKRQTIPGVVYPVNAEIEFQLYGNMSAFLWDMGPELYYIFWQAYQTLDSYDILFPAPPAKINDESWREFRQNNGKLDWPFKDGTYRLYACIAKETNIVSD